MGERSKFGRKLVHFDFNSGVIMLWWAKHEDYVTTTKSILICRFK